MSDKERLEIRKRATDKRMDVPKKEQNNDKNG